MAAASRSRTASPSPANAPAASRRSSAPPASPARWPRSRGRRSWTGSVDLIQKARGTAADLGIDQRYAWPAFTRVAVDEGVTSVDVFTQTARSLATATNVVRAVDAVTNKPETGSTV